MNHESFAGIDPRRVHECACDHCSRDVSRVVEFGGDYLCAECLTDARNERDLRDVRLTDDDVNAFALTHDSPVKYVAIPTLGPALVRPVLPALRGAL